MVDTMNIQNRSYRGIRMEEIDKWNDKIDIFDWYMLISNDKIGNKKQIPFECGFNSFSIPFLIILLLLIFDIEITLLIPIILHLKYLNFY